MIFNNLTLFSVSAAGAIFFCLVYMVGSYIISSARRRGIDISALKDEIEIRKGIFTIITGFSILVGAAYTIYEFGLKKRAEDREALYGALGQLIDVKDDRPELSAAALLQLDRLGSYSDAEKPALVQILAAYLNERGKRPILAHNDATTRADIQIAIYVLSRLLNGDPALGKLVLLRQVDLRHVRLSDPRFVNVKLVDVDFSGALLPGADFSQSDLSSTSFKEAALERAEFSGAVLDFTNFDGADVSKSSFCDVRSAREMRSNGMQAEGATCLNQ